jgi:hypothetical protein
VKEFTVAELYQIADERTQWAIDAHAKDLHGSAKEWEQTAAIATQLAKLLEAEKEPK